ncbi:hypothetical protein ACLMJK_004546 [Lecanora helva]
MKCSSILWQSWVSMAPPNGKDDLAVLQTSIVSTVKLINNFSHALRSPIAPHAAIENPPQPLALLRDSCSILKTQTTKLSLLILNKPFTPSAITYILNECSGGCLPAMMSALQLFTPDKYTLLLHNHIKSSLSRIMMETLNLLDCIPQDEHGVDPQNRDTLASTGVLWGECDKMVTLASDGLVSLALQKVEQYHSLLKDAITELDEWDPDEEDSDSEAESVKSIEQEERSTISLEKHTTDSSRQNSINSSIAEVKERSLKSLRTVRLLYPTLQKRRISTFPNITNTTSPQSLPPPRSLQNLDASISSAQYFTETADEVAGALYDGNEEQVVRKLKFLEREAESCSSTLRLNWQGQEDEFSEWIEKWVARLKEVIED